jgi:type II secretory pathway pseudopilin PulG
MNRRIAYGRLALALALPLLVVGLIGVMIWRAEQQEQAAASAEQTVQAAIKTLRQRQAEYRPGGSGYRQYIGLLNDGFAAPDTPAALRKLIGKLAHEHEITVQDIQIGEMQTETAAAGLALHRQPVIVTASATSDSALFTFIDAVRQSGHAELGLDMLRLTSDLAGITGTIGFTWNSLEGAPQLEYTETPVVLPEALAPGKSLFASAPSAPIAAPAPMLLKVENKP